MMRYSPLLLSTMKLKWQALLLVTLLLCAIFSLASCSHVPSHPVLAPRKIIPLIKVDPPGAGLKSYECLITQTSGTPTSCLPTDWTNSMPPPAK